MRLLTILQTGGVVRKVAVSNYAYRRVRDDPAMIDHVPVEAVADILPDGRVEWIGSPTEAGRDAIESGMHERGYIGRSD